MAGASYLGFTQWAAARRGRRPWRDRPVDDRVAVPRRAYGGGLALESIGRVARHGRRAGAPPRAAADGRALRACASPTATSRSGSSTCGSPATRSRRSARRSRAPRPTGRTGRRATTAPTSPPSRRPPCSSPGGTTSSRRGMLDDYVRAAPRGPARAARRRTVDARVRRDLGGRHARVDPLAARRICSATPVPRPASARTSAAPAGGATSATGRRPTRDDLRLSCSRAAAWPAGPAGGLRSPTATATTPPSPTPSLGGPVLLSRRPVVGNRPLEARADVLTYTTAALEEPLEAIGPVRVRLYVRSSLRALRRLRARVRRRPLARLAERLRRARAGDARDGRQLVRRDLTVAFDLWPTAHRFGRGHRIRLQVSERRPPALRAQPGDRRAARHRDASRRRRPGGLPRPPAPVRARALGGPHRGLRHREVGVVGVLPNAAATPFPACARPPTHLPRGTARRRAGRVERHGRGALTWTHSSGCRT